MTTIDELRAKLEREEEILNRCRPELDALKIEIGPWMRATAAGIAMAEPVEARKRQAELQAELWTARDHMETRRQLGEAENRARRLMENIAVHDATIAELQAAPRFSDDRGKRLDEEIARVTRYRQNDVRLLDLLGTPSPALASEAMKVA